MSQLNTNHHMLQRLNMNPQIKKTRSIWQKIAVLISVGTYSPRCACSITYACKVQGLRKVQTVIIPCTEPQDWDRASRSLPTRLQSTKTSSASMKDIIHKFIHWPSWLDQLLQDVQDSGWEHNQRDEFLEQRRPCCTRHARFESFIEFWCNHVRMDKIEGRRGVWL